MTRVHRRLLIGGLIAVGLLGAGIVGIRSLVGPKHRTWTEDVLLEDGSTIVVKRSVTFNESNSWSGDAYNATELSSTIAFTGNLRTLPGWNVPLMPLVLYRDTAAQGQWVVVATTTSCETWNWWGEPRPMYWEFRLEPGGWREVPLSHTSIGRSVNLLHRYQQRLGARHITVAMRLERESGKGMLRFREIQATTAISCSRVDFASEAKRPLRTLRKAGTAMSGVPYTAALGGDLAYRYNLFGTLSDISFTPSQGILSAAGFGSSAQTLQALASLQDGTPRLS